MRKYQWGFRISGDTAIASRKRDMENTTRDTLRAIESHRRALEWDFRIKQVVASECDAVAVLVTASGYSTRLAENAAAFSHYATRREAPGS